MEPTLTDFYVAYHKWLTESAPIENGYDFRRYGGLCYNLNSFINALSIVNEPIPFEIQLERCEALQKEMCFQFIDAGLCMTLPFNEHSNPPYHQETYEDTCHLNYKRIRWVADHLPTKDIS